MKIYCSGPITGIEDGNRPLFARVSGLLIDMGHSVFNPHEEVHPDAPYREALMEDLTWICTEAEGMVMLPMWERSPGARAEKMCAEACKLPIWLFVGGPPYRFNTISSLAAAFGTLQALGARDKRPSVGRFA